MKFLKEEDGNSMVEQGLLVGLLGFVLFFVYNLGSLVGQKYERMSDVLISAQL